MFVEGGEVGYASTILASLTKLKFNKRHNKMATTAKGFGLISPTYKNIAASTLIKTGVGQLRGIFVASAASTPTIKIWDNTSAATTVLINTFTPAAATYYKFADVCFGTGLYVEIGNTVDCTVFYF